MRSRSLLAAGLALLLATALNASSLATTGKRIAGATSCEVYHLGGGRVGRHDIHLLCAARNNGRSRPTTRV